MTFVAIFNMQEQMIETRANINFLLLCFFSLLYIFFIGKLLIILLTLLMMNHENK